MTSTKDGRPRKSLVDASLELLRTGLNHGTAGNISVRVAEGMLITPSGIPSVDMTSDMIVAMPLKGDGTRWKGPHQPSSEWRLHRDILIHRSDVGAIVHTHSLYATILSTQHRPIPALHYMIAAFGGSEVRCTPYARFGTQKLSDLIVEHLGPRHGVLLGNHGMVVTGATLELAMWRALELENLAKMYVISSSTGAPVILPDDEIVEVASLFDGYGMTAKK